MTRQEKGKSWPSDRTIIKSGSSVRLAVPSNMLTARVLMRSICPYRGGEFLILLNQSA